MLSLHVYTDGKEAAGKEESQNRGPGILPVEGENRVDEPCNGDQIPQSFPAHLQRIALVGLSESEHTGLNSVCCRAFVIRKGNGDGKCVRDR
jgi:hypothetical protein